MPSRGGIDWTEVYNHGRKPETQAEKAEMAKQMDKLGLKGAYNPKNIFPDTPRYSRRRIGCR
ncbi:hypothetical protein BDZ45DRAFT_297905 [Acephala macrosclerotiorum]|nr:hypothetical protein BDZ45DRAFT_297905 [Acephala macrosclerotiorum]